MMLKIKVMENPCYFCYVIYYFGLNNAPNTQKYKDKSSVSDPDPL